MYELWHISTLGRRIADAASSTADCLKPYSVSNFRQVPDALRHGWRTLPYVPGTLCSVELFAPLFWFVLLTSLYGLALNIHELVHVWRGGYPSNTLFSKNSLRPDLSWCNVRKVRLLTAVCMFMLRLALIFGMISNHPELLDGWLAAQALSILLDLVLWLFDVAPRECSAMSTFVYSYAYWMCVYSLRRTLAAMCCPSEGE